MLTKNDAATLEYMISHHNGKCAYNTARTCDGLCNNCPHRYMMEVESQKALGIYIPDYSRNGTIVQHRVYYESTQYEDDYEDAILARQEAMYDE